MNVANQYCLVYFKNELQDKKKAVLVPDIHLLNLEIYFF